MTLKKYSSKRNFKITSEPPAVKAVAKKTAHKKLMFVVQEHHASHLHYDFRLELDGVLKSWAVPKGPSLDPKTKRLAIEVEDHPLAYGKFEGIIPEHQYGAGDVYIWDTGEWTPSENPRADFKKGHIKFELKGKKLKGHWALVRTKTPSKSPQWLLIKENDQFVKPGNVAKQQNALSKKVRPRRIPVWNSSPKIKQKAPQISRATSRKANKPTSFVEPELAQLVATPPEGDEWIHETKFDGYRMQAHLAAGKVKLISRNQLDWASKFPTVSSALKSLNVSGTVLDGEVVWLDDHGLSDFQRLQNALKSQNSSRIFYYVFDILYLEGKDLRSLPLIERKDILKNFVQEHSHQIMRYSDHLVGDAKKFYKQACAFKLEGIISKRADSSYVSGRNGEWRKSKCVKQQEFVIGGYTEGTGARQEFGALLLGVYDKDQKLRYVGKVGTGFTEKSLRDVKKVLTKLETDESPFDKNSPRERKCHWVKPEKSAEISFSNWTEGRHLRVPVFHGLREDKLTQEIHKEEPVKKLKASLNLTHPDKIIFEKEKLTKLDLAEFYQSIADKMMPQLADRPLSLVRCPAGSGKNCFFQKHWHQGKTPDFIESIDIEEKNGTHPYMLVNQAGGLTPLVQMGAFEIHVWNCHANKVDNPDQFVMDFDPGPGVPWKEVISAAFELKDMLEVLHLKSFVKLSGGKGVHVHIPIKAVYSWDQVKAFTKALAEEMERRNPDKYVSKMSKKIRPGKIFVDYLRNGRGATAIAAYSLRAREMSAVAMPITWNELKKTTGGNDFHLKKALTYLKKRKVDPWAGYEKLAQVLTVFHGRKRSRSTETSSARI